MMKTLMAALVFSLMSASAFAVPYTVDPAKSAIAFSGQQAGVDFKGVFEKWNATIDFDPEALQDSHIDVTIDTSSAKTGNAMYDGTLPKEDWFNTEKFPQATFKSTSITKLDDGTYKAEGDLTIRNVTKPVSFNFSLDPADASTPSVSAKSTLSVDRLVYGLGVKSDGKAEWVSKNIAVQLTVTATKKTN